MRARVHDAGGQVTAQAPARRPRHATSAMSNPVIRTLMGVVAAALGFSLVMSIAYYEQLQSRLSANSRDISSLVDLGPSLDAEGQIVDPAAGRSLNVLLIGSDIRDGENGDIGGAVATGMRSDTTLVMHISADRSRVEFLSIPRDSRVRIADCKMFDGSTVRGWNAKFNTAFANGGKNGDAGEGAACTMKTITELTGLTFDHYAVIDFAGFRDMVDAVGGVPMCVEKRVKSRKAKLDLEAGPQVLNGSQALAWARARTGTGLGDGTDLKRIERQQELMNNLARKSLGLNLLTDAGAATLLIKAVAEAMTMDPNLASVPYLLGLAYSLRNIDSKNIVFETVPWEYPGDKSGDVVWKPEAVAKFERLADDVPLADPKTPDPTASADPKPSKTPGGSDEPTPSVEPSADATATAEPTAPPKRETEQEILDQCDL